MVFTGSPDSPGRVLLGETSVNFTIVVPEFRSTHLISGLDYRKWISSEVKKRSGSFVSCARTRGLLHG